MDNALKDSDDRAYDLCLRWGGEGDGRPLLTPCALRVAHSLSLRLSVSLPLSPVRYILGHYMRKHTRAPGAPADLFLDGKLRRVHTEGGYELFEVL